MRLVLSGRGPSAAALGLYVLLASITMLFLGTLVAYVAVRANAPALGWSQAPAPGLPLTLGLASLLLVGTSVTLERARVWIRENRLDRAERELVATCALAVLYLAVQALGWHALASAAGAALTRSLFPFTFYLLTGVHAAHVVAGLVPLALVLARAIRREYSSSAHEGLTLCATYWHYLGGAWLVIVVVLVWGA